MLSVTEFPSPSEIMFGSIGSITEESSAAQVSSSANIADLGSQSAISSAAQVSSYVSNTDLGSHFLGPDLSLAACAAETSVCTSRDLRISSAVMAQNLNDSSNNA
jgi:hypothetical protein